MAARLFAAVRRWVHVALFGWADDQCDALKCTDRRVWADPDDGPGALCTTHRGSWS